jgi:hypothetical protein
VRKRSLLAACALALVLPGTAAAAHGVLKPSARFQAQPADAVVPAPETPHRRANPRRVPDPDALKAAKDKAKHAKGPATGGSTPQSGAALETATAVFGGLNQPGFSATDNTAANNGTPPDTTGAIGPSHYLEFVNAKVGVYSRADLSLLSSRDLDVFVGRSGQNVFDPQIQFDPAGNRWLYVADDVNGSQNFLALGWSKTADPSDLTNGWCRFVVGTGSAVEDFPKLGHDNNHIIIGSNSFGNFFQTAHVWSVAKPANGDASCTAPSVSVFGSSSSPLTTADGTIVFTPVPANTADSLASGFVVAADSPLIVASPAQIMAWHVSGPPASPSLVSDGNMNVTGYGVPANVPQPGTSKVLDSSDTRLTQAVAHSDPDAGGAEAVWTQHTIAGPGGRSVARWYELLPASLSVRQQGTIQNASHFVFNAAISPAVNGSSAVIDYNIGSGTLLAQIRAQSRGTGMALGAMDSELTLGTSSAADQDFSCTHPNGPPCRWGDYAGASPDPLNDRVVWGSSQVNGPFTSDPHWATRNFAIQEGTNGYPRPKSASPMRISLVPAFKLCAAPNRTHGPPLAFSSCSPPVQASGFLTIGTPDSNGAVANATGFVRLTAIPGDPATPADEANVGLAITTSDIRRKSDLQDYAGQLQASVKLRLTDHQSGASQTEPATSVDFAYTFTVPCATTPADSGIGSTCSLSTTADALSPGTVVEGSRTVWQLDQAQIFDGGSDGVASTAGNTLFEVEGVFVP